MPAGPPAYQRRARFDQVAAGGVSRDPAGRPDRRLTVFRSPQPGAVVYPLIEPRTYHCGRCQSDMAFPLTRFWPQQFPSCGTSAISSTWSLPSMVRRFTPKLPSDSRSHRFDSCRARHLNQLSHFCCNRGVNSFEPGLYRVLEVRRLFFGGTKCDRDVGGAQIE